MLWAGTLDAAEKWEKLIASLAESAEEWAETGYHTYPLQDDDGLLCLFLSNTLQDMGIEAPHSFPHELEPYFSGNERPEDDDESGQLSDLLEDNPYSNVIRAIFDSLTNVWGFYTAYVEELLNEGEDLRPEETSNIEPCLMDLAASKIDVDVRFAKNFETFKMAIKKNYEKWLTALKTFAFREGIPLRAELLDMVHEDDEGLGHTAEAESLGFNVNRLHPDMYMNELLVGMRIIHQVLPAILNKLNISAEDFTLDESDLHIKI